MLRRVGAAIVLACIQCAAVHAQDVKPFPTRPVTLVVPYSAGGGADVLARILSTRLSDNLGQPVTVDNRAGASGIIGTESVARAPADGHTLLVGISSMTINPAVHAKLPYDAVKDFVPVTLVATTPYFLVAPPSLAATNVRAFIEHARAQQVAYATDGTGSISHLGAELFASMAGIRMVHAPYKTVAQQLTDVSSGVVQMMFLSAAAATSHVKSGRLRALAVTSDKRSSLMPDVPTVSESGVAGYELVSWYGIFAPAGTPAPVVQRLQAEIARTMNEPAVRDRLTALGVELVGNTPAEFASFVRTEMAKWSTVAKQAGIKAQ